MSSVFFEISSSSVIEGYLQIGSSLNMIQKYCSMSEFQYLDKTPIKAELDSDSGTICQDFIYENSIPLISERLKAFFDRFGIDNLFYKKILLCQSTLGIEEPYWLALPPRIDCLDMQKCLIDPVDGSVEKIVINGRRTGRYEIFKLARVTNTEILVSQRLAEALEKENFEGLYISPLE